MKKGPDYFFCSVSVKKKCSYTEYSKNDSIISMKSDDNVNDRDPDWTPDEEMECDKEYD